MRRLLRWAFNLSALVSAVLFVGVCVLWVRSYWWTDLVRYQHADPVQRSANSRPEPGYVRYERGYSGTSRRGHLVVILLADYLARGADAWSRRADRNSADRGVWVGDRPGPSFLGFAFISTSQPSTVLIVPYWAAVLAASLLPAAWVLHRRRQRRKHPGLCPACGYDLRATPGRCSECGTVHERA